MGKLHSSIDNEIRKWIDKQQMFFTGTAPSSNSGSINVSPKGHDTLRVLDEHTLAFLDCGGSGIETIAHLRENGRIVIMMCAFEGPPKIFRFHGKGEVITPLDEEFEVLAQLFDRSQLGIRSIIRVRVTRISDSCGWGVPLYEYREQRDIAPNYAKVNEIEKIKAFFKSENTKSIDGLPGETEQELDAYQGPIPNE